MPFGSVLFSAGRGERLRPLTDEIPKPALPVLDVPLGASGLSGLLAVAPPVVVNASHLPDAIAAALGQFGEFELFREPRRGLGTAGTLKALEDELAPTFVTLNSDALTDLDLEVLVERHKKSGGVCTAAAIAVESGADFVGKEGRVTSFVDRRIDMQAAGYRFIGAAVFTRDILRLITEEPPLGLGESVFPPLVNRGELVLYVHDGYALDVGNPTAYMRANLDVLSGRVKLPADPPGEIVQMHDGRAYMGPGSQVNKASLGPGAIVLRNARIGDDAAIQNTIVMPGEEVTASERLAGVIAWAGRRLRVD
jgi:NDP-sugar pyrophosphorylase family protein